MRRADVRLATEEGQPPALHHSRRTFMAISARSRRGTSASFWRNHNALQLMMAQACMPSVRPVTKVKHMTVPPIVPRSAGQRPRCSSRRCSGSRRTGSHPLSSYKYWRGWNLTNTPHFPLQIRNSVTILIVATINSKRFPKTTDFVEQCIRAQQFW